MVTASEPRGGSGGCDPATVVTPIVFHQGDANLLLLSRRLCSSMDVGMAGTMAMPSTESIWLRPVIDRVRRKAICLPVPCKAMQACCCFYSTPSCCLSTSWCARTPAASARTEPPHTLPCHASLGPLAAAHLTAAALARLYVPCTGTRAGSAVQWRAEGKCTRMHCRG